MENEVIVIFYFVSGLNITIEFSQEKFDELFNILSKSWDASSMGKKFGVNFNLVTHYEVLNKD